MIRIMHLCLDSMKKKQINMFMFMIWHERKLEEEINNFTEF